MILGIGHDLVEIERIREALARFSARFTRRIFTGNEMAYADAQADPAQHLAARFAAKEAVFKALGGGTARISWQDIEIMRMPSGAPEIRLAGAALARARVLKISRWHLSLTHTRGLASAVVIAESDVPESCR